MRVETHEHALDGVLEQRAVVDFLDITETDLVEHVGKSTQLIQGQFARGRELRMLGESGLAEKQQAGGGDAAQVDDPGAGRAAFHVKHAQNLRLHYLSV